MTLCLKVGKSAPVGVALIAEFVKSEKSAVNLVWGTVTCIKLGQDLVITSVSNIFRHLARSSGPLKLYGSTNLEMAEVDHWISFASKLDTTKREVVLENISKALAKRQSKSEGPSYLVGPSLTAADLVIWGLLFVTFQEDIKSFETGKNKNTFVIKWYKMIEKKDQVQRTLQGLPSYIKANLPSLIHEALTPSTNSLNISSDWLKCKAKGCDYKSHRHDYFQIHITHAHSEKEIAEKKEDYSLLIVDQQLYVNISTEWLKCRTKGCDYKTHRFDYFHIHVEKAHLEVLKMKAAEIPTLLSPASRSKYHTTNNHEGSLIETTEMEKYLQKKGD